VESEVTAKNFSPGDVVVCVNSAPHWSGHPCGLTKGKLYTVERAAADLGIDGLTGAAGVIATVWLAGEWAKAARGSHEGGYSALRFRLAFTPDPEVEREHTEVPIKRPVSA